MQLVVYNGVVNKYRGVVFDLDGTAVPDGALEVASSRLIEAFQELPTDVVAIAATGRVREHALPIAQQLGLRHGLIATNGADVIDVSTGETIWSRKLSVDQVLGVLGICGALEYQLALEGDPMDRVVPASAQSARECAGAFLLNAPFAVATAVQAEVSALPDTTAYLTSGWSNGTETFDVNINHRDAGKGCLGRY